MNKPYNKKQSPKEIMEQYGIQIGAVQESAMVGALLVEFFYKGGRHNALYNYNSGTFKGVPPGLEECFNSLTGYLKDVSGIEQAVESSPDLGTKPGAFNEPLLTIEQVAEGMKLSKSTIYNLIYKQGFPAFKVGKSWRFRESKILKWLDEREYKGHGSD